MNGSQQNNCSEKAHVNIQLLRYIILLLNISKDDLIEVKNSFNDTDQSSFILLRRNDLECVDCDQPSESKMASPNFQNSPK